MYIQLIRNVLVAAVKHFANRTGRTEEDVLNKIREHMNATTEQHYCDEPDINYQDPLCRLGYLYRHATANATLFEHVLRKSPELQEVLANAAGDKLHICAVGGGPGTELLGIAKYFLRDAENVP